MIINESDAYLVKTEDIDNIANKVLLIANDRQKLIDMGKNVFADSERFSAENVFKMWDDFFN